MDYPKTKIYFDGSHYIGIPKVVQPWKRRKQDKSKLKTETEEKVKEILKTSQAETKEEKVEEATQSINQSIKNLEKSKEIVDRVLEKNERNRIVRLTRLYRKAYLQQWDYFCTFTYDSKKLSEEEFKVKFLNCIRHLASRKGWKYIGVFERSPELNRLHFHGIFVIPEMVGELIETKDYSTKNHQMQVAQQNTYFLEKFGRNDFRKIENNEVKRTIRYMLKYIRKTGDKIIYSKHLQTFFITDILEDDVVCKTGNEDRKILLFDNFKCMDFETGECLGEVTKELIDKLPKAY